MGYRRGNLDLPSLRDGVSEGKPLGLPSWGIGGETVRSPLMGYRRGNLDLPSLRDGVSEGKPLGLPSWGVGGETVRSPLIISKKLKSIILLII